MKKKKLKLCVFALLLVFCLVYFYGTFRMKPSEAKTIADSFMPRVVVIGLAAMILIMIRRTLAEAKAAASGSPEEKSEEARERTTFLIRILFIIAVFVISIACMEKLGFVISMCFFLLAMFLGGTPKEQRNYFILVPLAVILPLGVFLLFLNVFSILLPPGILLFLT